MSVKFHIQFSNHDEIKANTPYSRSNGLFFPGNNKDAIILIHGLTGSPHEMRFLSQYFKQKGYSVDCPRLANHGEPLAILKTTRWEDFYQSIRESFIRLKDNYNNIYVAGLSMGALLALLLSEEFPDNISAVGCLSPTLFYDGWNVPWYRCFLPIVSMTFLRNFFYFKEEPPYGIKDEKISQKVHDYYTNASLYNITNVERYGYPYFPVTLLHQLNLLIKYLNKRLGNITVPVQIFQAKEDDLTTDKNSQFIYERINSKIKEIVLLYNSYHIITAGQERKKVAQEMERFFNNNKRKRALCV